MFTKKPKNVFPKANEIKIFEANEGDCKEKPIEIYMHFIDKSIKIFNYYQIKNNNRSISLALIYEAVAEIIESKNQKNSYTNAGSEVEDISLKCVTWINSNGSQEKRYIGKLPKAENEENEKTQLIQFAQLHGLRLINSEGQLPLGYTIEINNNNFKFTLITSTPKSQEKINSIEKENSKKDKAILEEKSIEATKESTFQVEQFKQSENLNQADIRLVNAMLNDFGFGSSLSNEISLKDTMCRVSIRNACFSEEVLRLHLDGMDKTIVAYKARIENFDPNKVRATLHLFGVLFNKIWNGEDYTNNYKENNNDKKNSNTFFVSNENADAKKHIQILKASLIKFIQDSSHEDKETIKKFFADTELVKKEIPQGAKIVPYINELIDFDRSTNNAIYEKNPHFQTRTRKEINKLFPDLSSESKNRPVT